MQKIRLPHNCYCKVISGSSFSHFSCSSRYAANSTPSASIVTERRSFHPKRILVLAKLTRLEFEKRTHPGLSDEQLKIELSRRGSDFERLLDRHHKHKAYLEVIKRELRNSKIETRIVDRFGYNQAAIEWADAVFSAGGDGTFLLAASRVTNNEKPVIGINTDPNGSEGYLCLFQSLACEHFKDALEQLLIGDVRWLYRQRIRVRLRGGISQLEHVELHEQQYHLEEGTKWKVFESLNDWVLPRRGYESLVPSPGQELVLPELALNDIFMGESHSSRVSYLEVQFDDQEPIKQKSSGITVCTGSFFEHKSPGTGSTSWFFNINKLSDQSVSDLLKIAAEELSIKLPYKDPQIVSRICRCFNKRLVFSPTDRKMAFSVRDPVYNSIFRPFAPRGFAKKITVRSRCFDAHIVIDGGVAYKFNDGSEVVLEVYPNDTLKTAVIR